jgi:hypothetical protein
LGDRVLTLPPKEEGDDDDNDDGDAISLSVCSDDLTWSEDWFRIGPGSLSEDESSWLFEI